VGKNSATCARLPRLIALSTQQALDVNKGRYRRNSNRKANKVGEDSTANEAAMTAICDHSGRIAAR